MYQNSEYDGNLDDCHQHVSTCVEHSVAENQDEFVVTIKDEMSSESGTEKRSCVRKKKKVKTKSTSKTGQYPVYSYMFFFFHILAISHQNGVTATTTTQDNIHVMVGQQHKFTFEFKPHGCQKCTSSVIYPHYGGSISSIPFNPHRNPTLDFRNGFDDGINNRIVGKYVDGTLSVTLHDVQISDSGTWELQLSCERCGRQTRQYQMNVFPDVTEASHDPTPEISCKSSPRPDTNSGAEDCARNICSRSIFGGIAVLLLIL